MRYVAKVLFLLFITFSLNTQATQNDVSPHKGLSGNNFLTGPKEEVPLPFQDISKGFVYFSAGAAFESVSILARLGWGICRLAPWASSTLANECLLLSHLTSATATHAFAQMGKTLNPLHFSHALPFSYASWILYQNLLSRIPTSSLDQEELLSFLKKRWLAKSSGFYASMIDWVYPCFGVSVQVQPQTGHTYARDPTMGLLQDYKKIVEDWRQHLPHPQHFPLILTRPFDIKAYLPACLSVPSTEAIHTSVEKISLKMRDSDGKVLVDLTDLFSGDVKDREEWLQRWNAYRDQLLESCRQEHVDPQRLLCIQRVQRKEVGGMRLLPLRDSSAEQEAVMEADLHWLLGWIGLFGLSANRIELDRYDLSSEVSDRHSQPTSKALSRAPSREAFLALGPVRKLFPISETRKLPRLNDRKRVNIRNMDPFAIVQPRGFGVSEMGKLFPDRPLVHALDQQCDSVNPQKALMLQGTLHVLQGLFESLPEAQWNEIVRCPVRASVVQLSCSEIEKELRGLSHAWESDSFFCTASRLEQVHAHLTSLLEVLSPFAREDFAAIYEKLLTSLPPALKGITSYAVHSSGMTSLAGILKAVERSVGGRPRVICGENSYYEAIHAANLVSEAIAIEEVTAQDWQEVDLILSQFNPVLKRIDAEVNEYRLERVAENVRKALCARQGNLRSKPLTVAIDCTLDFIDSPRVGQLLVEFQEAIEQGMLNVICYRSGLKFDLFGMDNYCGAPMYMIHSPEPKWAAFDLLCSDPALQTDRLSLNWFCLAYRYAAPQLEQYRRQTFGNTRALLNKVPAQLLKNQSGYRVIPIEAGADPSFIDIKITGPYHHVRGSALVGGLITLSCMEKGHPIFYRQSLGFYHPNFSVLFCDACTTIRLTLGLDPAQVDVIAECLEKIDALTHPHT